MRAPIEKLRTLMLDVLRRRGIAEEDAQFIVADYLEAQLEGRRTHGIAKFLLIDSAIKLRAGEPTVIGRTGAMAAIDGQKEIGQIVARRASRLAVDLAEQHGIGLVTVTNASRFSRLVPYVREIAESGFVGIVTNNAGPPAVAPVGSRTPILGTNPIAFGFPGLGEPILIDFSTAERVWGEIRQAVIEKRALPLGAFLDANGEPTTDPQLVESVLPFGGAKGSALCLAIELLAGLVAGAKVGLSVENEYELGSIFIALRPRDESDLGKSQSLLHEIRTSAPRPGFDGVRAPGDASAARRAAALSEGEVDVDENTLEILTQMSSGEDGLAPNRLTN